MLMQLLLVEFFTNIIIEEKKSEKPTRIIRHTFSGR